MSEFEVSKLVHNTYSRVRSGRPDSPLDCAQKLLASLEEENLDMHPIPVQIQEEHEATRFFLIESCVILKVHHPEHDIHAHSPVFRELLNTHEVELGLLVNFWAPTELSGIKKFLHAVPR